jgi:hypothetical protein
MRTGMKEAYSLSVRLATYAQEMGQFLPRFARSALVLQHTSPVGMGAQLHPVVALVTAGVEMDVLSIGYTSSRTRTAAWSCRRSRVQPISKKYPAGLLRRHQRQT